MIDLSAFETVATGLDHPEGMNVAFTGPGLGRLAVSSLGGWSIVAAVVGVAVLPLRYPKL